MKLDTILKGFNTTITKLEKLASSNKVKEGTKTAQILTLKDECIALEEETTKAEAIAAKLRELVS